MRIALLLIFISPTIIAQGFSTYATEFGSGISISYRVLFKSAITNRPGARVPMLLKISNKTDEVLTWDFKSYEGWGEISDSELNKTLTVEPKAMRTYTLNLPYKSAYNQSYFYSPSFKISGPGIVRSTKVRPFGEQLQSGKICTQSAYKKIKLYDERERKQRKSKFSSSRPSSFTLDYDYTYFDSEFMSVDWHSYSGLIEMLMTVSEFQLLQEEVKIAIRDWVLSGGVLILADPANDLDKEKVQKFFTTLGFSGLGAVHLLAEGKRPDSVNYGKLSVAEYFLSSERKSFLEQIAEPKASFVFFCVLLVLFLILLIPVNLFVFTNKNRLKLLVTTPLISLGASIVFFIVIILSDGFGGRGAKSTLVYLNPELKRCSIFQSQASSTGVMGSKNFDVTSDLLLDACSITKKRWESSLTPVKSKVVINDENIGGDIFNSRTRRFADFRHIQSTQGSIELIEGEEVQLRSSFQSPLEEIYLFNKGQYWKAENLKSGELVVAKKLNNLTKGSKVEQFGSLMKINKPSFFATLSDAGEFDIPTHQAIDWIDHEVFVSGPVREVGK